MIISDIRKLLDRIEDAVPLINLAITTSGANLSTTLPAAVSPSRLLQASTFLTAGDTQYSMSPSNNMQIGPTFTLSMYMLFAGHIFRSQHEEGIRETTWKEVIHKARVRLLRVPLAKVFEFPSAEGANEQEAQSAGPNGEEGDYFRHSIPGEARANEFAYQLLIIEDLDDDRVHTFDEGQEQPSFYEGVPSAGIREIIPIHEVSKIFYADTGKILNIGADSDTNSPVLLLKRDVNAIPPRRMMDSHVTTSEWYDEDDPAARDEGDESHLNPPQEPPVSESAERKSAGLQFKEWRLPSNLDPEWIAFEVYTEDPDSDSETEPLSEESTSSPSRRSASARADSVEPTLAAALAKVHLDTPPPSNSPNNQIIPTPYIPHLRTNSTTTFRSSSQPAIRTSLSLLEMLIRLTALQQFQQSSHLAITDELLNFFLEDSSTTGAGADSEHRRRVRRDARQRVGFDPYDESPVKRRGEEYLDQQRGYHYDDGYTTYDSPSYRSSPAPEGNPRLELGDRVRDDRVPSSPSPLQFGGDRERNGSPALSRPGSSRSRQALLRTEARAATPRSPLGRDAGADIDSTLGTSPGSETVGPGKRGASRTESGQGR